MNVQRLKSDMRALLEPVFRQYAHMHNPMWGKYIDKADTHFDIAITRYHDVRACLKHSPKSLLDLGAGAGYTPYIFAQEGTQVSALDLPYQDFYDACLQALGIPKLARTIEGGELLELPRKYEVITGFAVTFDRIQKTSPEVVWSVDMWEIFLDDLLNNYLLSPGMLYLELVRPLDLRWGDSVMDPKVIELCKKKYGAVVGYKTIIIKQ
ncbi:MAG: hypothetical protein M0R74_10180 [Dehalococcoidia bacterium]|nr:hypothetical protein [Dehalococcoidia bacterium]